MNNRDYKQFASGEYYHVYNRGVGKMDIFRERQDYALLLSRLKEALFPPYAHGAHVQNTPGSQGRKRGERKQLPTGAFTLVCYALMPNHYHLLLRQNTDLPISSLMSNVFGGYAKVFNKRYDRVGSLFQDQFKAIRVDSDEYLLWLSAYIHANPTVAGIVGTLEDYPYASYPDYIGTRNGSLCDKSIITEHFKSPDEYRVFVSETSVLVRERKDMEHLLLDM